MASKKRNPILIFNIFYWVSFGVLFLPQYFFPTVFFSKSATTWFLILSTNIFSYLEPRHFLWVAYGAMFTAFMFSFLMSITKNMKGFSRATVFIIYLVLNTSINIMLSDW